MKIRETEPYVFVFFFVMCFVGIASLLVILMVDPRTEHVEPKQCLWVCAFPTGEILDSGFVVKEMYAMNRNEITDVVNWMATEYLCKLVVVQNEFTLDSPNRKEDPDCVYVHPSEQQE